jgi:transposase InsO family protein
MTPDEYLQEENKNGWLSPEQCGTLCGITSRAIRKQISLEVYKKEHVKRVPSLKGGGRGGEMVLVKVNALPPEIQIAWHRSRNSEAVKVLTEAETDRQSCGPLTRYASADEAAKWKALKKTKWVEGFLACKTKREKALYAANHHKPLRTLYAWARMAKLAGGELSPTLYIRKGIPQRGPKDTWPKEMIDLAVVTYLQDSAPCKSRVAEIVRATAEERGWPVPARATVDRWLDNQEIVPPSLSILGREGQRAYRDKAQSVIRRDWNLLRPNECWIGDHHELDLMVVNPDGKIVRPWVTSWLDGRSRLYIGWYISESPCADTIALALSDGILPSDEAPGYGVPEAVLCDNGRDYKSHHLNGEVTSCWKQTDDLPVFGLFADLGIKRRWTKTYSARSKATKERSYGVIERRTISQLPGYTGSNPQKRPERLKWDVAKTQLYLNSGGREGERLLLTWWQMLEVVERVVHHYNHHIHGALSGKSPAQVWEENRAQALPVPQAETLDLLVQRRDTKTIRNEGIRITFQQAPHESRVYHHPALFGKIGERADVRYNPYKRDSIVVIQNRKFLCNAGRNDDAHPFDDSEEGKARVALQHDATGAQLKEFRSYLDTIQQNSLRGFLAKSAKRPDPASTIPFIHPSDRAAKASQSAPANYAKTRGVAEMVHENGTILRLWEHEIPRPPTGDRP